jgi:23S rRNA (uracil1939-C5)-methyltransferase
MTEISFIIRDYFRENNFPAFDEKKQDGLLKYLIIRKSFFSSEILICIVTSYNYTFKEQAIAEIVLLLQDYIKKKNEGLSIAGILQNINNRSTSMALGEKFKTLYGKTFMKEKIAGNFFHVGISTFLQVNPYISDKLYSYVKSKINPCERILDIYSGIGTLTLYLADKANKIYGIEINPESVLSANNAAKANQIKNVKFISGDATRSIQFIKEKIDLIVVDPPRIGLTKELIDSCFKLNPERIIYISCDPLTLKRDLYYLENKYKILEIQAFDMFPFTKHIETVVILDKL